MSLSPPKPSPLVPGYRLDRYELLCPIAQGGMAEVWVARLRGKHGFQKLVAIKTILPQFAQDNAFQRMFLDEAHIAAGIQHQNVAQILDLGEEHDVLYLVMEWVDGDALSKLQRAAEKKNTHIPIGIVLRILADTCGGLHAAHELSDKEGHNLGVVHRDVSPQNILVSNKGVAKLIDFGIAKARDRMGGDTSSGMLKGKIHYMAPEQALGQPIDRRADVWAIGAMLHHLVSGKPPFQAANQLATLHLLASGRPAPPLPKSVPDSVVQIVRRTLKHDPGNRIATAAELQSALEAAMVDAWVSTSTADVATFMVDQLADRAESRRKAVDLALKAAAEREKMIEVLKPPDSSTSISDVKEKLAGIDITKNERAAAEDDLLLDVALDPAEPSATVRPPERSASLDTPGSSVLDPVPVEPGGAQRKRVLVIAAAVVGALVVLGSIAILLRGTPKQEPSHSTAKPKQEEAQPAELAPASKASDVPPPPSPPASSEAPLASAPPVPSTEPKPKLPIAAPPKLTAAPTKTKPTASAPPIKKPVHDDGF